MNKSLCHVSDSKALRRIPERHRPASGPGSDTYSLCHRTQKFIIICNSMSNAQSGFGKNRYLQHTCSIIQVATVKREGAIHGRFSCHATVPEGRVYARQLVTEKSCGDVQKSPHATWFISLSIDFLTQAHILLQSYSLPIGMHHRFAETAPCVYFENRPNLAH